MPKLRWTPQTATYWVADKHDAGIKKWRSDGKWYYAVFFTHAKTQWSAGAFTLADAKDAAQTLADALGKGE